MRNFHGTNQPPGFFEGWYLKHEGRDSAIAFIPAYHVDKEGAPSASLQVITDERTFHIPFPAKAFRAANNQFCVKLGNSFFSDEGASLNLQADGLQVLGNLSYTPLTPLHSDIMGPFRFLPFLQCNHGVVSLSHKLSGALTVNGKRMDFSGGTGYIEKDWGKSFPQSYLWTQYNWDEERPCCVMLSAAHIPFLGGSFTGCISSILYEGKEYRLATYQGVKIVKYTEKEIEVRQGRYRLSIRLLRQRPQALRAPSLGGMTRTIHESLCAVVQYRFWENGRLLFDVIGDTASFEQSDEGGGKH